MNKQPEVTATTRRNLCQAFWELYGEKPIEKITVREITDRAGYNRATFYLYFHDVYDLLAQIEEGVLADVRSLIEGGLMREETLDLSHYMGQIALLAARYDNYLPQLMGPHGDPSFARRLKDLIGPLVDRYLIPAPGLSPQERDIVREFYLSGLLSSICAWMVAPERMPIEGFIALIVNNILSQAEGVESL